MDRFTMDTVDGASNGERIAGRALLAGAVLCLIGAGGLSWWRHGASVFTDMIASGLTICF